VDGNTLTIASFTQPTQGTLVDNGNGTFTYTPSSGYFGTDSYTYTVSDGQGGTATATVTINVAPVNDAPVAAGNTVNGTEDAPLIINAASLLSNDSDLDGDVLSIASFTQPAHGTLVDNGNGTFTYTPAANYHGPDSYTYTVTDGNGGTATATVSISVASVNDSPAPVNDTLTRTTGQDTPVTVSMTTLLGNDVDHDGDTLTIASFTQPAHGTVVDNGNGTFTYTPDTGYDGTDSYTYTVSDGQGGLASATVTINVVPAVTTPEVLPPVFVNTPPVVPVVTAPSAPLTPPASNTPVSDVITGGQGSTPPNSGGTSSNDPTGTLADSLGLPPVPGTSAPPSQPPGLDLNALPAPGAGQPSSLNTEDPSRGFPVTRLPSNGDSASGSGGAGGANASGESLFVYQGIQDSRSNSADSLDYQVPREAFGHTDPGAVIRLEATLADGSPLPGWIQFDGVNGAFSGVPPTPTDADVDIKVTARDEAGRQAEVIFRPVIASINGTDNLPTAPGAGAAGGISAGTAPGSVSQNTSQGSSQLGFPVERISASGTGADNAGLGGGTEQFNVEQRLFVFQGVNEAASQSAERYEFKVPRDAFAHTDPSAVVRLQATLADGTPLPPWLTFDPIGGVLTGNPPNGEPVTIEVKITARDDAGREANVIFAPTIAPATAVGGGAAGGGAAGERSAADAKLILGNLSGIVDNAGLGLKLGNIDSALGLQPSSLGSTADAFGSTGAFDATVGFDLVRLDAQAAAAEGQGQGDTSDGYRLFVYQGMTGFDFSAGESISFRVPADAFAHTDPGARVVLEAHLADGSPLPAWLSFNSITGAFSGLVPLDGSGALDIEIVARDEEGRIARAHFKLDLDTKVAEPAEVAQAETSGEQVQQTMHDKADAEKDAADAEKSDTEAVKTAKSDADKPVKLGTTKFSEQTHAARTTRDPVLARILAEKTRALEKPPV
jgi:hypothetical protein